MGHGKRSEGEASGFISGSHVHDKSTLHRVFIPILRLTALAATFTDGKNLSLWRGPWACIEMLAAVRLLSDSFNLDSNCQLTEILQCSLTRFEC